MSSSPQEDYQFQSPWTDTIIEVLGVHLHRYLVPMLLDHEVDHIFVSIGFEQSRMPGICMRVGTQSCDPVTLPLNHRDLVMEARASTPLDAIITKQVEDKPHYILPVLSISEPGREHIHAFALSTKRGLLEKDVFTITLRTRINEAVRAFRHNMLRILFDESDTSSAKDFLSTILAAIPVWCGADHSASLILSSSLESMVMSSTGPAQFQIVQEDLYVNPQEGEKAFDNLTNMEFLANQNNSAGLLGCAFEETRSSKSIGLNIFIDDSDTETWFAMGDTMEPVHRFSTQVNRPRERMTVILPLLGQSELGENELMGFLSINFFEPMPLSSLASRVLETLALRLGSYLRKSSIFTLFAQQLWLLECVREEQVAVRRLFKKAGPGVSKDDALEAYIERVNALMAKNSHVAAFGIGYKRFNEEGEEILRFVSPQGFTRFSRIDLPIHHSGEGSSLSTLAVRLNRPIMLTGGSQEDGSTHFSSPLYVHEAKGILADIRVTSEALSDEWKPLGAYYKPSRDGSYAAVSYPIRMGDDVVGVIAVEIERGTQWVWWKGYSSYLFYRLLANEIAADFALLGTHAD